MLISNEGEVCDDFLYVNIIFPRGVSKNKVGRFVVHQLCPASIQIFVTSIEAYALALASMKYRIQLPPSRSASSDE